MNRIGQKWSDEDIRILRKRILEGVNVSDIANELERCQKGVKSKGYSLGLKFSKTK